jgi:hypothetical protein
MFAQAKLAETVDRVKPERPRQREISFAELGTVTSGVGSGVAQAGDLNYSNRPVRTRMPGGVAGVGQLYWLPLCRLPLPNVHELVCNQLR